MLHLLHPLMRSEMAPRGHAFDPSFTIHGCFSEMARQQGDRAAILGDGVPLSYFELDQRANKLARYLSARGIGTGSLVGVFLHRSADAVIAMLGVLKAGAAFAPLDPAYPRAHLAFVMEDARPAAVISAARMFESRAEAAPWAAPTILLDAEADAIASESAEPIGGGRGEDPAYVMYTSGTTGRPKGVIVPHRGVVRLARNNFVDVGPEDSILQMAPLAFDASTFEIWAALLNGAAIVILGSPHPSFEEIGGAIARHKVTTAWLTAGLFHSIVDHRLEALRPLRVLIAGGDVLSPRHVRRALDGLTGCRIINGYGPTENTTFTCCYAIPRDAPADAPVPIGPPIAHTKVYILDEKGREVPAGEVGELFAAGEGVALGYLNRPELTAEKFPLDRFDENSGRRMYRTGDLVRRRSDGVVEFVGRADRQVKISGKRVELDEVEALARQLPNIADAVAIVCERDAEQRSILVYVAPLASPLPDPAALRREMLKTAPDYLVPSQFVVLEALPLTPNGKVDRAALPAAPPPQPETAGASGETATSEAATKMEAALADLWRNVLKRGEVSLDANFFDFGGSSLDLLALHAKIQQQFDPSISMTELFENTTIRALARRLERAEAGGLRMDEIRDRKQRQHEALQRARQNRMRSAP